MVIQRGLPHADRIGDPSRGGVGVPVRGEQLGGRVENLLAGVLAGSARLLESRAATPFAAHGDIVSPVAAPSIHFLSLDRNTSQRARNRRDTRRERPAPKLSS